MPGFLELLPRIAAAYREQVPAIAEQSGRLARALEALEPGQADAARFRPHAPKRALAGLKRSVRSRRRRLRRRAEVSACGGARVLPARMEAPRATKARSRSCARRSRKWPTAASTTSSAAASAATASTRSGRFRTSRRCSTTTRRCCRCMPTPRARPASRARRTSRAASSAGSCAKCARPTARSTRASTPTAKARKASSTSGRATRRARDVATDEWAAAAPYYGLDGAPNFEGHAWHLRVVASRRRRLPRSLGIDAARRADASRRRARGALRGARDARAARPRRQDPDVVERADDRGAGARVAGARRARVGRLALRRARRARPHRVARRAAATPRATATTSRSTRISTITRSCSRRCSKRCRRASAASDWTLAHRACRRACSTRFEDRERGGFWFTSHDHERLYHRTKPAHDNATPSGNGIAAQALIALGHLASEPRYVDAAERAVRLFAARTRRIAGGRSRRCWSRSSDCSRRRRRSCLAGDPAETRAWQRQLERAYRPDARDRRRRGDARAASAAQGRRRRRRARRLALPRHAVPAAGHGPRRRSKRSLRHPLERLRAFSVVRGGWPQRLDLAGHRRRSATISPSPRIRGHR